MTVDNSITCYFILDNETHYVTFDNDDIDAMGDDIFVFTAYIDPRNDDGDDTVTIVGNLRGESPADELRARGIDVDGAWFLWERDIANWGRCGAEWHEPGCTDSAHTTNGVPNAGGKPGRNEGTE